MRALLVNSHGADPAYGGAERYVRELAAGLAGRGWEVAVLSAFPQRTHVEGLETMTLHGSDWREDTPRRIRNRIGDVASAPWPRIASVLEEFRPDLVHTGNLPGIGTGSWEAARRAGIPTVHTLHDYYLLCARTSLVRRDGSPCSPSPLLCGVRTRRLARWAGAVDAIIAGSQHLLGAHAGIFAATPSAVIRLPLAPSPAGPLGPPAALRDLGYLGALTATKGVDLLLAAAPELARSGVRVRIAGDGPLRARVEDASVDYAGRLDGPAVAEFTRACDAGIVPSTWEEPGGPPYTVCDWLAARRPVLAARRGGLTEMDGLGGVTGFEPTSDGIVGAVSALRDPGSWDGLVAALPEVADDRDLGRWLDEHEAVYRAAIARRHP
jgi:glycosyltransferase involved in cell wall biosynthesis